MSERYEVHGGGCFTLADVGGAKFCRHPGTDDGGRFELLAQFYCVNEDCCVREVEIHAKWPDGNRPDYAKHVFKCPSCGKGPLKFHHFIEEEMLVVARDANA